MFHMAGKWKLTGDGSTGSPYTTFKLLDSREFEEVGNLTRGSEQLQNPGRFSWRLHALHHDADGRRNNTDCRLRTGSALRR